MLSYSGTITNLENEGNLRGYSLFLSVTLGANFLTPTTFKPPFKINGLLNEVSPNPGGTAKPEKSSTTKRENPVQYHAIPTTTDDADNVNDVSHVSDSKVPAANQNRVKTGSWSISPTYYV
jgi:hypothetical protein